MDPRIEKTIEELKNNGWAFQTSDQKPEWWFDEALEMNSIWKPIGVRIYFTIDIDPDATSNRRKGQNVISLSLSKSLPTKRLSDEQSTFYLSELDKKGIRRLAATANELRNKN